MVVTRWWVSSFIRRGFIGVIFSNYINREVSSDVRATAVSLSSMCSRVVYSLAVGVPLWHFRPKG
ncbi:hypothetical protein OAO01_09650 [Oligoflexia bacterium]|nr:hypothetical protein [Oligoflexia bacterium]